VCAEKKLGGYHGTRKKLSKLKKSEERSGESVGPKNFVPPGAQRHIPLEKKKARTIARRKGKLRGFAWGP